MNKWTILIGVGILVVIGAIVLIMLPPSANAPTNGNGDQVASFAECVDAGNPVMESYPRQCRSASGQLFVEDIGNANEKADLIIADFPRPGDAISSPLVARGQARGNWYFEASFPVEVLDANGNRIGQGYAQAQGEWMTTDFVPFRSIEVSFPKQPAGSKGTVVLHKDNPSGLPEHDDQLTIPVTFK